MSIRLTTGALHVKNGGSYDTLDVFRGYSDVDDELDSLSENPVQNKVIKSALDEKLSEPSTAGSAGQVLASNGQGGLNWATGLPSVTASDDGKFLMVVNGAWSKVALQSAEGSSF